MFDLWKPILVHLISNCYMGAGEAQESSAVLLSWGLHKSWAWAERWPRGNTDHKEGLGPVSGP